MAELPTRNLTSKCTLSAALSKVHQIQKCDIFNDSIDTFIAKDQDTNANCKLKVFSKSYVIKNLRVISHPVDELPSYYALSLLPSYYALSLLPSLCRTHHFCAVAQAVLRCIPLASSRRSRV